MNSRKGLADELTKVLPKKYKVVAEPRVLDALEAHRPVVMLIRTSMAPALNSQGSYLSEIVVWVIEPKTIDAEDDLDDALDAVLLALDSFGFLTWSKAERSTYVDQPAYRIETTNITSKD